MCVLCYVFSYSTGSKSDIDVWNVEHLYIYASRKLKENSCVCICILNPQLLQVFIVDKNIHESMRTRTSRMLRHRHMYEYMYMHLIGFYTSRSIKIFQGYLLIMFASRTLLITSNISFPHCLANPHVMCCRLVVLIHVPVCFFQCVCRNKATAVKT